MTEEQANAVAEALGADSWNSGGEIWLVVSHRHDGSIVVLSEDVIKVYESQNAFDADQSGEPVLLH
jgi:hypothetical protein